MCELLRKPELAEDRPTKKAAKLATFSLRVGGAGLRSAVRTEPAAYSNWASWADVLPMLQQQCTEKTRQLKTKLRRGFGETAKSVFRLIKNPDAIKKIDFC